MMRSLDNVARVAVMGGLLAAALGAGCEAPAPPTLHVWAAGEMVALTAETPPVENDLVYSPAEDTVSVFAAGNETVSFQLVADAADVPVEALTVHFSDLTDAAGHTLSAERIRLFRMWPVEVSDFPAWYLRLSRTPLQPGPHYDALIPADAPRHGAPFALAPGGRLAMWVDLAVPADAAAGDYTGTITLTSRAAGGAAPAAATIIRTVGLNVRVLDFVLPGRLPLAAVGGFDHEVLFRAFLRREGQPYVPVWMDRADPLVAEGLVIYRQLMRLAREHRLDLFDTALRPVIKRGSDGGLRLHWTDYDAIVKPYLDGTAFGNRIGVPVWPAPLAERWPDPRRYGGIDSDSYRATADAMLAETVKHFEQMGFADRLFVWPIRGRACREAYPRFAAMARHIRAVAPGVPILTQLPPDPPPDMFWKVPANFAQLFDMLAPPAELLRPGGRERPRRGVGLAGGVYLAPGKVPYAPPLTILASPADVRATPWLAYSHALTGLWLPDVLGWDDDPRGRSPGHRLRLFHPGRLAGLNAVLPSVRLKRLRRGLQDIVYLSLLEQWGRGAVADDIARSMARYVGLDAAGDHHLDPRLNGWVGDPRSWPMARRLLATEVAAAIHPDRAKALGLLAQRMAWQQFEKAVRTVRVERIRTRVSEGQEGQALVELFVDVCNELNRPAAVLLKLPDAPKGYRRVKAEDRIDTLAPRQRHTLELAFTCIRPDTDPAGKIAIPMQLHVGSTAPTVVWAHVPVLVAGPAPRAITVDGDLADWPAGAGNAAQRFVLIGRRGRRGAGLAERRTTALLLHGPDHLYLAFRCSRPKAAPLRARTVNDVRYDQLLAVGEDMVEAIFDPGARGQHPEDLFRIIIKANGIYVTETGVPSDPPLGLAGPWAAPVRVAVRPEANAWVAEAAIPLSAFGPGGRARRWGVNFARYSTAGAEASNWAGTPRCTYHPRDLGTLFLLPGPWPTGP